MLTERDFENLALLEGVEPDSELKNFLVEYVGNKMSQDGTVTLEMIVEVVASEFPEFMLSVAEENYMRGYMQALDDMELERRKKDA